VRACRHIDEALAIAAETLAKSGAGEPPWMLVCEDCAASMFEAIDWRCEEIEKQQPSSGKSGLASTYARMRRLLEDMRWNEDNGGAQ
jgi:hypothetical protein